jgi:hypothetical protein
MAAAGTLAVNVSVDSSRLAQQVVRAAAAVVQFFAELDHAREREQARQEYRFGQLLQKLDPRWEVFTVTTNEGRCRVVVRRRFEPARPAQMSIADLRTEVERIAIYGGSRPGRSEARAALLADRNQNGETDA